MWQDLYSNETILWGFISLQARSDDEWTNDCRDILLSDESGKGQVSQRYLECMYWAYGFKKEEAKEFAKMGKKYYFVKKVSIH